MNIVDEAKLCSQIVSTFEVLVVYTQPDMVMEKNWAPSFDQCWLQALQFWFIWLIFSAYVSNIMVSLGFRIL